MHLFTPNRRYKMFKCGWVINFHGGCVDCGVLFCFGNLDWPWFRSASLGYLVGLSINGVCVIVTER